ncbi:mitochondrial peptide methionine sulfoxide reductase isoform X2 [Gymnodraco acuticeps]|uniref:peptide-methionine (S)-S-oxide reductase n=1 Tax=Gymnodraco acuticeps TaxID=8218 RepID=A0A6P8VBV4_GYMAC|nr:mitochondrial peptide methionine sulfoxide reductase isoform X2 [Gymnodraco acuticeps]
MALFRKRLAFSQFFSQTVWFLLLSVSLAATDSMADKTQLPSRDRCLKGREEKMVVAGLTGHNEVVRVVYSPEDVSLEVLLKRFWEKHDPTQGMRQQNDRGTQYRSAIYTSNPTQQDLALKSKVAFQQELDKKGYGPITTEILEGQQFYYAEDHHQQYLKKVPKGYCGLKGTGVSCPIGARKDEL